MTGDPAHIVNSGCTDEKPVWLVTGAARGVGRIFAEMALRHGNRVVATADRLEDLWPLIDDYTGAVIPIELDVNDEAADRETVQRVIEILGRLDVVVNAAGYDLAGAAADPRLELERVQTNLFGALWVSQAALGYMCANTGGRIIQVAGLDNSQQHRDRQLYDSNRRALVEFSERLAREGAPFGVEVSVCVAAELFGEWSDNSAGSYTLDAYDPPTVASCPPFSDKQGARTTDCSKPARRISSRSGDGSPPGRGIARRGMNPPCADLEIRQHHREKGDTCT
jgi:NAD(P)-dependent dehydrogenase (short-subunit alcohol dehydrogenase family)